MRIVDPRSIHLTLVFLGEQPATEIDRIAEAMELAPTEPIPLALGEPLLLPPRNPRTFTLSVADPTGRLQLLKRDLAAALDNPEKRQFRPHLTLARLGKDAQLKPQLDPPPRAEFTIDRMTLYRSYLEPTGARYEPLAEVAFNQPLVGE